MRSASPTRASSALLFLALKTPICLWIRLRRERSRDKTRKQSRYKPPPSSILPTPRPGEKRERAAPQAPNSLICPLIRGRPQCIYTTTSRHPPPHRASYAQRCIYTHLAPPSLTRRHPNYSPQRSCCCTTIQSPSAPRSLCLGNAARCLVPGTTGAIALQLVSPSSTYRNRRQFYRAFQRSSRIALVAHHNGKF